MEQEKVKMRLLTNCYLEGVEYLAGEVLLLEEPIARLLCENDIAQLVFGWGFKFGNVPSQDREKVRLEHLEHAAKMNASQELAKAAGFPF